MALLKVALTNLGKYNEGYLIYEWLELPCTDEELKEAFKKIGVADNTDYEEYFITDFESDVGIECNEYANIYELNEKLKELDGEDEHLIEAIIEADTSDLDQVIERIKKGNYMFYDRETLLDVAYRLMDDNLICRGIPQNSFDFVTRYIDYEQYANDLSFEGFHETEHGTIELL